MKLLLPLFIVLGLAGCSVGKHSEEQSVPYAVNDNAEETFIEVREYPDMILASTPIRNGGEDTAFKRLFGYISGENVAVSDIDKDGNIITDKPQHFEIEMTAPVIMDSRDQSPRVMSFVLPQTYTAKNTPVPTSPNIVVHKVSDYNVAAIQFDGTLNDDNIEKHRNILEQWIIENNYVVVGPVKIAGYDAPFTLPMMRRNEVLIPVEEKR